MSARLATIFACLWTVIAALYIFCSILYFNQDQAGYGFFYLFIAAIWFGGAGFWVATARLRR